jgi:proline dehydrogenase
MLRSFLIYLSKAAWAKNTVMHMNMARKAASRFYAGETVEDAVVAIRILNQHGIFATLDHLGENTTNLAEARTATYDILGMIDALDRAGVQANVSIKLSQIGLAIDEQACRENLETILSYGKEKGIFIRLDMEDSSWVEATLNMYRQMCRQGLDNVGVVIQSYLYRSQEDVKRLALERGRVRLCKGAYKEPPEVAFPKKKDVDENYDRLADLLLGAARDTGASSGSSDGKVPPIPALATHDIRRIEHGKEAAARLQLSKEAFEFQLLYGIRRELQEQLAREGYRVRVYVPFGTEWYPYYMRRLAERPANVWFFLSNFFRR